MAWGLEPRQRMQHGASDRKVLRGFSKTTRGLGPMQRHVELPQSVECRVGHLLTVIPTERQPVVVLVRRSSMGLTCTRAKAT
jgi:hypothetical protein